MNTPSIDASTAGGLSHPLRAGFVLVVDDDPLICAVVATFLRREGREVRTYPDADAALAALDLVTEPIDIVVTDVSMPGELDGIALAALVARRRPETPVVLMSGSAGSLARGGRATGVWATLAKPFTLDELGNAIAAVAHR
jgi:two-component system cell cycle sensor histidine kinase/response regulator CckA